MDGEKEIRQKIRYIKYHRLLNSFDDGVSRRLFIHITSTIKCNFVSSQNDFYVNGNVVAFEHDLKNNTIIYNKTGINMMPPVINKFIFLLNMYYHIPIDVMLLSALDSDIKYWNRLLKNHE
jgi:hypothetical protein